MVKLKVMGTCYRKTRLVTLPAVGAEVGANEGDSKSVHVFQYTCPLTVLWILVTSALFDKGSKLLYGHGEK
jgi:hypothetical protein